LQEQLDHSGYALAQNCHKGCICASNIISCSKASLDVIPPHLPQYVAVLDFSHNELKRLRAEWTPYQLPHLHSLSLSHNNLSFISTEAFSNVPHLKYLDLSSNDIDSLGEDQFSRLDKLEVLLLYGNKISKIDRSAFDEMENLQKLYLSHNLISPWVKNGLYVHNNPLSCRCELYTLFTHWQKRQLSSAVDFKEELICLHTDDNNKRLKISSLGEVFNCSEFKEKALEIYRGEEVIISCDTRQHDVEVKEWITPRYERVPQEHENSSVTMLPDGKLQIKNVSLEDMGLYTCFAVSQMFNETVFVQVTVHNYSLHAVPDTLNTAYTTLVGCILTNRQEDSINSSVLSTTPNHNAEVAGGKEGLNRNTGPINLLLNFCNLLLLFSSYILGGLIWGQSVKN
uniref:Adhesion molecule with Ig like domain 1 n=1 Tax=Salvator merianae TaxID=96440 RepID=A0A8D0DZM3_SALMN